MENNYIEMQILNQIQMSENFKTTCRLASQQDDGVIDTDEKKILEKIYKETDSYIKKLQMILK